MIKEGQLYKLLESNDDSKYAAIVEINEQYVIYYIFHYFEMNVSNSLLNDTIYADMEFGGLVDTFDFMAIADFQLKLDGYLGKLEIRNLTYLKSELKKSEICIFLKSKGVQL